MNPDFCNCCQQYTRTYKTTHSAGSYEACLYCTVEIIDDMRKRAEMYRKLATQLDEDANKLQDLIDPK